MKCLIFATVLLLIGLAQGYSCPEVDVDFEGNDISMVPVVCIDFIYFASM